MVAEDLRGLLPSCRKCVFFIDDSVVVDVFDRAEVREWFSLALKSNGVDEASDIVVFAPYGMNDRVAVLPRKQRSQ
jgi:hypothetical protein